MTSAGRTVFDWLIAVFAAFGAVWLAVGGVLALLDGAWPVAVVAFVMAVGFAAGPYLALTEAPGGGR